MTQEALSEAVPAENAVPAAKSVPAENSAENSAAAAKNAPQISVVVPVYKVEKFVAECLESILAQDFDSFEIVAVDDGSPDASGKICDEFAARDSRLRVFHKENGGVTSARKLGVERSRGEWICFVDSDDILLPRALSALFAETKNFPDADIIEGSHVSFRKISELPKILSADSGAREPLVTDNLSYAKHVATNSRKIFRTELWSKLIRRTSLLGTAALDISREIIIGEDKITLFRAAPAVRRVVRIFSKCYAYRENDFGVCRNKGARANFNTPEYAQKWTEAVRDAFVGQNAAWQEIREIAFAATLPVFFKTGRGTFLRNPELLPIFRRLSACARALEKKQRELLELVSLGFVFPFSLLPESVFRRLLRKPFKYLLVPAARIRRVKTNR